MDAVIKVMSVPRVSKLQYTLHVGLLCLILSISLFFLRTNLVTLIADSHLAIAPGTTLFESWKTTAIPSYLEIYVHNWTNPYDIHNDSIKPKFSEVGPFRFKEVKEKVDIVWNDNNTVTYRQVKRWYFDEKTSCCDLSTKLTTINAILVTTSYKTENFHAFIKLAINTALRGISPDMHVTTNASNLLFDGYPDPILALMKTFPILSLPPIDRFGWFFAKNGSTRPDGLINMDSTIARKGEIRRWNTWTHVPHYASECAGVHGSAGELYPPGRTRESVSFFSTDMCRNVPLDYDSDVTVHGLTGYKYIAGDSMFDNGTKIPGNECYCNGECLPSGALNISSCRFGTPVYISLPHFYGADPFHVEKIDGLVPNKNRHEFSLVLEPSTGLPLQAAVRFQMNLLLRPVDYMPLINDVPRLLFPILWFQLKITTPEEFGTKLKLLFKVPAIIKGVSITLIVISLILTLIGLYHPIVTRVRKKKKEVSATFRKEQEPLRRAKD